MSTVNELRLEIFNYIISEEGYLHELEKKQDAYSDDAHIMEEQANLDYNKRLAYINAVQEMRRYRSGVMAHHAYVNLLRTKYMEMDNKLNAPEE